MPVKQILKKIIPDSLQKVVRPIMALFISKNSAALSFWKSRIKLDNGVFKNGHYRKLMLGMAEESDDGFISGMVVADFGCGPRGSLAWAQPARLRIGIDVLADRYADEFTSNIVSHDMIYVKSTEKVIPLPSNFVDVLFTLNAIDHVNDFPLMCAELIRIMKPGGTFIGSFNLEEPASPNEPQRLNEDMVKTHLLDKLQIQSYRVTEPGPSDDLYAPFFNGDLSYRPGEEGFLWVRASKPE